MDKIRHRWKRTSLIILILGITLSGCNAENSNTTVKQEHKITLTFRHFWTKEHDKAVAQIFADVIRSFEAAHPHIKIEAEGIDQTFHREQKLKSEMVAGNPPDIFALFGGAEIEPYARAERLLDLTPFLKENNLHDQFIELSQWTFDGGTYGLPFEGNAEPIYYNRTIFDKLKLTPPQTWDELLEIIPILKENGYVPFAIGNDERWPGAIFYHYLMQRRAGPTLIDGIVQGTDTFETEAYKQATEDFIRLAALQPFTERTNDKSKEFARQQFVSGKAALYLNGSWEINVLQGAAVPSNFMNEVGVMNFPVFDAADSKANGLAGGYTIGLGVSANLKGERLDAALEFMKAVYTPEVQRRMVYEGLRLPSMNIMIEKQRTGPIFASLMELMLRTPHMFIPYDNKLPPAVQETFFNVTQDLLERRTSASQALNQLQTAIEQYREVIRKGG